MRGLRGRTSRRPCLTCQYRPYGRLAHPERARQLRHRKFAFFVGPAHIRYSRPIQPRLAASAGVFCIGDGFEMIGVYTLAHSAKVVYLQPHGDRGDEPLVVNPVRPVLAPITVATPVPGLLADVLLPYPTRCQEATIFDHVIHRRCSGCVARPVHRRGACGTVPSCLPCRRQSCSLSAPAPAIAVGNFGGGFPIALMFRQR